MPKRENGDAPRTIEEEHTIDAKLGITPAAAPDIPTFYANNVGSMVTIWDLRLDFGLIQDIQNGQLMVQPLARVVMSPTQMKAFASLLNRMVKTYERKYGSIELPEGTIPTEGDDEG